MTDIKTVDNSQTLTANGRGAVVKPTPDAAKAATTDGNILPDTSVQAEQAAQQQQAAAQNAARTADREQRVDQAVAKLNDYVQSLQRDLRFTVDDDLGRAVVHVVDRNTQEVIRQIPNETALRLARNLNLHMQEMQMQQVSSSTPNSGSAEASLGLINTRI